MSLALGTLTGGCAPRCSGESAPAGCCNSHCGSRPTGGALASTGAARGGSGRAPTVAASLAEPALAAAAWGLGSAGAVVLFGWQSQFGVGWASVLASAAVAWVQVAARPLGVGAAARSGSDTRPAESPARSGEATLAVSVGTLLVASVAAAAAAAPGQSASVAAGWAPPAVAAGINGGAFATAAMLLAGAALAVATAAPALAAGAHTVPGEGTPSAGSGGVARGRAGGGAHGRAEAATAPAEAASPLGRQSLESRGAAATGTPGSAIASFGQLPRRRQHTGDAGGSVLDAAATSGTSTTAPAAALAAGDPSPASRRADSRSTAPRKVGVPVLARALRICGVDPSPMGRRAAPIAIATTLALPVVWELGVGWLLLRENPVSWLLRFLAEPAARVPVAAHMLEAAAAPLVPAQAAMRWLASSLDVGASGAPTGAAGGPPVRLVVVAAWALAVPVMTALAGAASRAGVPRIVVRKLFHVGAAAMLAPVVALDPALVAVAAAGAMRLFAAAEVLRAADVPVLGRAIATAVAPFVDQRDGGGLVATHAYLLAGCALPVWLLPLAAAGQAEGAHTGAWSRWVLLPQAGIIAVALADAASAAVGSQWGRVAWPHASPKTVEGTLAGAMAGIAAVVVLAATQAAPGMPLEAGQPSMAEVVVAMTAFAWTAAHETFTGLIDNAATPAFATALVAGASLCV